MITNFETPTIDLEQLHDAARQQLGEACNDCAHSLIAGVASDWTASFLIFPLAEATQKVAAFAATVRELQPELDELIPVVEAMCGILQHEKFEENREQHQQQMLAFGIYLAQLASELLPQPSVAHAICLYYQSVASRCLDDQAQFHETRQAFETVIQTQDEPWSLVYAVRQAISEAEAARLPRLGTVDLATARIRNLDALKLADALQKWEARSAEFGELRFCVPGIRRAAMTNLWLVAVSAKDWTEAAFRWQALCESDDHPVENLSAYSEFPPHALLWIEGGNLPLPARSKLTVLLYEAADRTVKDNVRHQALDAIKKLDG